MTQEREDLALIVDTAIRDWQDRRYACNEEGLVEVKERLAESIAAAVLANGYRKQSDVASEIPALDACRYCEEGDEKCGTCVKFFGYCGEQCSIEFDSPKCIAYKPVTYCWMCGRKRKGERYGQAD